MPPLFRAKSWTDFWFIGILMDLRMLWMQRFKRCRITPSSRFADKDPHINGIENFAIRPHETAGHLDLFLKEWVCKKTT